MGLFIYIYKQQEFGDCSINGVSNRFKELCLTNVEGPSKPDEDRPEALLIEGNLAGTAIIVPHNLLGKQRMMGGCYGGTSDSRFSQAVERITGGRFYGAIPIHDRVE